MENTGWLKQGQDPLFADLLWSRPEIKRARGKLLVVGGHSHSIGAVSEAYDAATQAGIGSVRAMLPDSLAKTIGKIFPEASFSPSTISGGFSLKSLADIQDHAAWADGLLLCGAFGRNSETGILIERLAGKYAGPLSLSGDTLDYFAEDPRPVITRPLTTVVATVSQLQKLLAGRALIKHSGNLATLVNLIAGFTSESPGVVVTHHAGQIIVSRGGRCSTTLLNRGEVSMASLAGYCSVWQLQQPGKIFEAITSAVFCYAHQAKT